MPAPRVSGEELVSSFIKFGAGFIGTAAAIVLLPKTVRFTFRFVLWNLIRKSVMTAAVAFISGQATKYATRFLQRKL